MTLRRIFILATVCLFGIGLLASPAQAFKGTYKVGAVFSVTGRTSFLGDPEKKTAEMIAEQINQAGGINGNKLELIIYDTEGDATKANLAVKKLITKDKVCAVIGPSLSGTSLAVLPLAEQNKTNKWLAQKLSKNETTISRWCTNEFQPSLETLKEISELLNIDVRELLVSSK